MCRLVDIKPLFDFRLDCWPMWVLSTIVACGTSVCLESPTKMWSIPKRLVQTVVCWSITITRATSISRGRICMSTTNINLFIQVSLSSFFTIYIKRNELKIENCFFLNTRGNSYCRCKSSAKDLGLESYLKDYHQKLTY